MTPSRLRRQMSAPIMPPVAEMPTATHPSALCASTPMAISLKSGVNDQYMSRLVEPETPDSASLSVAAYWKASAEKPHVASVQRREAGMASKASARGSMAGGESRKAWRDTTKVNLARYNTPARHLSIITVRIFS